MNTRTDRGTDARADLLDAIRTVAFVRSDAAKIVAREHSSETSQWIIDLRALLLQATWLDLYAEIFWDIYQDRPPFQVCGIETAGIALVAAIVLKGRERGRTVNGCYLRKSRKRYGLMKYVEGTLTDEPVVFVDDLINGGSTVLKAMSILEREGVAVTEVFTLIAFRAPEAYRHIEAAGARLTSLYTLEDLGLALLSTPPETAPDDFSLRWHYRAPRAGLQYVVHKSRPVLDAERLYVGCDDGFFRALDRESGALVWEFPIRKHPDGKAILSSPALYRDVVYFGAYDGSVYALDAKRGTLRWRYDDADWIGSSPAIAPELGLLFIGAEYGLSGKRGGILAIDLERGEERWRASHPSFTHGSPLYLPREGLVVIGSNNGVVHAYDAKAGTLRWFVSMRGDIKMAPAYDAHHRAVFAAAMDGSVFRIDARSGTVDATFETGAGVYSSPLVSGDSVFIASLDKTVYALSTTDLSKRWTFETGGRIFSSPIAHENLLWVGSNDGRLYGLEPSRGTLERSFQAPERIVSAIAADGDVFYVPTVTNEIYCLDLKEHYHSRTK